MSDDLTDRLTNAVNTFLTEIRGVVADALKEAEESVRPKEKKAKTTKTKTKA